MAQIRITDLFIIYYPITNGTAIQDPCAKAKHVICAREDQHKYCLVVRQINKFIVLLQYYS